jgi:hypothetical protein
MTNKWGILAIAALLGVTCIQPSEAGIATALAAWGGCQTVCNFIWLGCVAAAGGTAAVTTGGAAAYVALTSCNTAQTLCFYACGSIVIVSPTP